MCTRIFHLSRYQLIDVLNLPPGSLSADRRVKKTVDCFLPIDQSINRSINRPESIFIGVWHISLRVWFWVNKWPLKENYSSSRNLWAYKLIQLNMFMVSAKILFNYGDKINFNFG